MDELLEAERREALIEMFTSTARLDVLTNLDALTIIQILRQACEKASVEMEESIMTRLINGEEIEEGHTPGLEEEE